MIIVFVFVQNSIAHVRICVLNSVISYSVAIEAKMQIQVKLQIDLLL